MGQTGTDAPHLHFEIKDQPAVGHGYTGYGFTGLTIGAWGINYFSPSWFIENHRQLGPFYLAADASNPTGVFFVEGETKRGVSPEVFNSWGFSRYPIEYIDHETFESYATGSDLTKIACIDGHVYFIDRGEKKGIPDANMFNIWGFDWDAITPITPGTLNSLPTGTNLSYLAQMEGSASVFLVDAGVKHPILYFDLLQYFGYPSRRDVSWFPATII